MRMEVLKRMYKSKRAKATDIDAQTRFNVHERDSYRCVICGDTYRIELAHTILSRSKGGLGNERNLVCLCQRCHRIMDSESEHGKDIRKRCIQWLEYNYGSIDKEEISYDTTKRKGLYV